MGDALESLDNSMIREKCIQYGLPNIPVTDTTRKVIIKKLRVSMGGNGPSTPKQVKKRRETIHNAKKPSPPQEVAEKKEATTTKPAQGRSKTRYTIADTSTMDVADHPRTIAPEPQYFEKAAEPNNLYFKKPDQMRTVKPAAEIINPREEVRFVRPMAEVSAREQIRSVQQPAEDLNAREQYRSGQRLGEFNTREQIRSVQPTVKLNSREHFRSYQSPVELNSREQYRPYTAPVDLNSRPQLSKTGVVTTSYMQETSPVSEKPRLYPQLDESFTSNTYGTSTKMRYTEPDRFNLKSSSNLSHGRTHVDHYEHNEEEDDDDELEDEYEEQEEDHIETPYLSNFARNLERLKDDPIAKLPSSLPTRISRDVCSTQYRASLSPQVRKQIRTKTDDYVSENFKQFLIALENKYNLRRNFCIISAVILAIFVYVFFIL